MQAVDEEIETIHLYVVKEKEKKPHVFLPLFAALLCVATIVGLTIYSAYNPSYIHETLTIPAHFLPLQTFSTIEQIIPTGSKSYPATIAHGTLKITNGSILSSDLPKGFLLTSKDGIEVVTDKSVFIPAGSADGYGIATVTAHTAIGGESGNIPAYDIDHVVNSSIYIRNLHPFTGGQDAYSVKIVTSQDKQTALDSARVSLTAQVARRQAILANPCSELVNGVVNLVVKWTCQFVSNPNLPGMKVTRVTIRGKNLIVDVLFVVQPKPMQGNRR